MPEGLAPARSSIFAPAYNFAATRWLRLQLLPSEDSAFGEQPNQPGTVHEHLNWCRRRHVAEVCSPNWRRRLAMQR